MSGKRGRSNPVEAEVEKVPSDPVHLAMELLKISLDREDIHGFPAGNIPEFCINRVVIDGFGPHDGPNELVIDDGLTLLTGDNGTGKTHIMLGIHWCLFGDRGSMDPWLSESDPLGKDLLNWNRSDDPDPYMKVEVTFKWGDREYRAERVFQEGKTVFRIRDPDDEGGETVLPSGLTPEVLPFLLFQGEAVMFLANEDPFIGEGNLGKVLHVLSGAYRLEKLSGTVSEVRSALFKRISDMGEGKSPVEKELDSLRGKLDMVKRGVKQAMKRVRKLATERENALLGYRKALTEFTARGSPDRDAEKRAMARIKAPVLQERLQDILSGASVEIIRKTAERALQHCLKERETGTRQRIMFGAFEAQASIVRSILESNRCMCGTPIGRTGPGRERLKRLLSDLEKKRDQAGAWKGESVWTADVTLEGARRALSGTPFTRKDYNKLVGELVGLDRTVDAVRMSDQAPAGSDRLISAVRAFESNVSLLAREREAVKRLKDERSSLSGRIRTLERDLAEAWGAECGREEISRLISELDDLLARMDTMVSTSIEDIRKNVEQKANVTLSKFEPGKNLGTIRIHPSTFRIGREMGPEHGNRILPMAYLSAGEREVMALAILSSIPSISGGMLMLDSPFPYVDVSRRKRLMDALPGISKRVFLSLPDGILTGPEIRRASDMWTGRGYGMRHYTLTMGPKGSIIKQSEVNEG